MLPRPKLSCCLSLQLRRSVLPRPELSCCLQLSRSVLPRPKLSCCLQLSSRSVLPRTKLSCCLQLSSRRCVAKATTQLLPPAAAAAIATPDNEPARDAPPPPPDCNVDAAAPCQVASAGQDKSGEAEWDRVSSSSRRSSPSPWKDDVPLPDPVMPRLVRRGKILTRREKYKLHGKPVPPVPWSPYWLEKAKYVLLPHIAEQQELPSMGAFSDAAASPSSLPAVPSDSEIAAAAAAAAPCSSSVLDEEAAVSSVPDPPKRQTRLRSQMSANRFWDLAHLP